MQTSLGLEVPIIETLEEHESNEKGQNEVEDGCGLMFEAVIERPISDESVEQIIFDLPPSMSNVPEQTRGQSRHRERCYPPPVVDLGLLDPSVVLTMSFGHRFLRNLASSIIPSFNEAVSTDAN